MKAEPLATLYTEPKVNALPGCSREEAGEQRAHRSILLPRDFQAGVRGQGGKEQGVKEQGVEAEASEVSTHGENQMCSFFYPNRPYQVHNKKNNSYQV